MGRADYALLGAAFLIAFWLPRRARELVPEVATGAQSTAEQAPVKAVHGRAGACGRLIGGQAGSVVAPRAASF